jgi:hypothetical protein
MIAARNNGRRRRASLWIARLVALAALAIRAGLTVARLQTRVI